MKIIGYNYAAVHVFIHLILAGLLYYAVQPDLATDYAKLALIALGTIVVDIDHIPLWRQEGVKGYLKLRSVEEFGKPRKYKLHNLIILVVVLGGAILIIIRDYFFFGLLSSAIALHLIWDLVEDVLYFKMGYKHWL